MHQLSRGARLADDRAQIAAQSFIREKEYGLAISYCTSAEDWAGLGRVVDLVLEEYIAQGKSEPARAETQATSADRVIYRLSQALNGLHVW